MSCKSGKEECQARSVLQECQVRVFQKSVKQECQIRVSCKSVLPERSAIVSGKGVRQECHLSVSSQCVPQVGSLEIVTNKYYIFVSQHTCRHSGSWASSCFYTDLPWTFSGQELRSWESGSSHRKDDILVAVFVYPLVLKHGYGKSTICIDDFPIKTCDFQYPWLITRW